MNFKELTNKVQQIANTEVKAEGMKKAIASILSSFAVFASSINSGQALATQNSNQLNVEPAATTQTLETKTAFNRFAEGPALEHEFPYDPNPQVDPTITDESEIPSDDPNTIPTSNESETDLEYQNNVNLENPGTDNQAPILGVEDPVSNSNELRERLRNSRN